MSSQMMPLADINYLQNNFAIVPSNNLVNKVVLVIGKDSKSIEAFVGSIGYHQSFDSSKKYKNSNVVVDIKQFDFMYSPNRSAVLDLCIMSRNNNNNILVTALESDLRNLANSGKRYQVLAAFISNTMTVKLLN